MDGSAPWHAHVYYETASRSQAADLRSALIAWMQSGRDPKVLFVGSMVDGPAGPHPIPQYEVHFPARARAAIVARIEASGLRALIHPLTDDDLADHTSNAHWIGEPVPLDESVLDPPGHNQGIARFGKSDF